MTTFQCHSTPSLWDGFHPMQKAAESGVGLPAVYRAWVAVVLTLYPLCRWFAGVKQRRREGWLRYL